MTGFKKHMPQNTEGKTSVSSIATALTAGFKRSPADLQHNQQLFVLFLFSLSTAIVRGACKLSWTASSGFTKHCRSLIPGTKKRCWKLDLLLLKELWTQSVFENLEKLKTMSLTCPLLCFWVVLMFPTVSNLPTCCIFRLLLHNSITMFSMFN